jgi:preprotein translocase subunit SecB
MNTFTIGQTKQDTELAIALHQNAQIVDVRLARARAAADRPETQFQEPIAASLSVKAKQVEGPPSHLFIEISFRLTGTRKQDESRGKTAVFVECTFEVIYQLKPDFTPTADQVKAFKDGNAIFNCWPYGRQYVQDTIQRLGFPPLILPFLRVQTKHREARKMPRPKQGP